MKTYHFYKWRIWGILACSFVMSLFHRGAIGVISLPLALELGLNASQLAQLASVTFYTYAMMQIPAGLLLDYFGYRKISYLGVATTGIGSILLGLAPHLYMVYIGRFLVGLGTSVIFISVLQAQKIWFSPVAFTKASAKLSFIGNLGGVIATFPLAFLVTLMGWRMAMILMGLICILISVLIFVYVQNSPTAYGYYAQGIEMTGQKINLWQALRFVFSLAATWRNFFVLFTVVGCTTTLTGIWGINYLIQVYRLSSTQASFYIAFIVYGLVVGSLFVEKIASYFKGNLIMYPRIACCLISLCWAYILLIAEGKPPLIILTIIFFMMGFLAMSHILAFTDMAIACSTQYSSLASSLVNSGEFIGSSIISLLIGFILDFHFKGAVINGIKHYSMASYITSFYVFLGISLLGVLTSFIGKKHTNSVLNTD